MKPTEPLAPAIYHAKIANLYMKIVKIYESHADADAETDATGARELARLYHTAALTFMSLSDALTPPHDDAE